MAVKIGINGFGRIGRRIFSEALKHDEVEVVAINDLTDANMLAHLLKYDTVHGTLEEKVEVNGNNLVIDGKEYHVTSERDPANLKWGEFGVDIVIEATGIFRDREGAQKHLDAGAKRVIISAPGKDVDVSAAMGVNENEYDKDAHKIVSNASCTTNCLAPVTKVLVDEFGLKRGMMTTVHSYTNDQHVLDSPHGDYRRARAAAENIIPTSTGAAEAVAKVLPEVDGKLTGMAVRVPSPNVSLVDLVAELDQDVTKEQVNEAMKKASEEGDLKGYLDYTELPLVSSDYNGNTFSSIVDGDSTMVMDGNMVKVISWYDNESGYSHRCIDLAIHMGKQGF